MNNNHVFINSLAVGMKVYGAYIVSNIRFAVTRTGNPYLTATLTDASGSIGMVCWEVDGTLNPSMNGRIIEISALVGTYRDKLQLCVELMEEADTDLMESDELSAVIPTAPIDPNAYDQYVYNLVQSIENPEICAICDDLLRGNRDCFYTIPGGMNVHHAFRHGLLMHTADMAMMAETIIMKNPDTVNRDLLLAGVLLHDIGKLHEFVTSPVTGLVTGYSDAGNLIGHSVLGALMIAEAGARTGASMEIVQMLQHMVLSHHGDPAAGAAKEPITIEAEILHDLDKLGSRKQVCAVQLAQVPSGSYTPKLPTLGRRLYRHKIGVSDEAPQQEDWDDTFDFAEKEAAPSSSGDYEFVSRAVATFPNGYRMSGSFDGDIFYPDDANFPVL